MRSHCSRTHFRLGATVLCKFCNESRELIRAHVIPEAFFRAIRRDGLAPFVVSPRNSYEKRAPIGAYDDGMLCAGCEALFGPLDSYGAEVLLNRRSELFEQVSLVSGVSALSATTINKDLLLRFLVSVLWRAHMSTNDFYQRADLGPFERTAKLCVDKSHSALPAAFDAILFQRTLEPFEPHGAAFLIDPYRSRFDTVAAYCIDLGDVSAVVKVDSRPFLVPLDSIALRSAGETLIVARGSATQKELMAMSRTVRELRARKLALKKQR